MNFLSDLETDLSPTPEFYVEPVDNSPLAETPRQTAFLNLMRYVGPRCVTYANANAGKRASYVARREGIMSGVFDLTVAFRPPLVAWLEFKGKDKRGRAGKLTDNQIRFGNRMLELGHPVGCFFTPERAVQFLRENGFPISEMTRGN